MPDKDLLNAIIYEENEAFITGEIDQPYNIKEIKYNLLMRHGKEFTSIWSRLIRGIPLLFFACLWVWIWGGVIMMGFYEQQQFLKLCGFGVLVFAATWMILQYAILYLVGKQYVADKELETLQQNSKFVTGRILQVHQTPEGMKVHFNFRFENTNKLTSNWYIIREPHKDYKPKKQVTVWYNDDDRVISTLL